jgi:hypothetical protein
MNKLKIDFVKELLEQYPHWFDESERMELAQMTSKNYPYKTLFSPIRVNRLTLKNRIVMGPMGNIGNPFAKALKEELQEQTLTADLVVLAMGLRPSLEYHAASVTAQVAPEVILLGDAFQIGGVFEAVKSGSLIGRTI